MANRFIVLLTVLLLAATSVLISGADDSTAEFCELAQCRKLYGYSGNTAAYFYGYCGKTLYSARALPDVCIRYTDTDGDIIAVCHNDDSAYALCVNRKSARYSVESLNMNSGARNRFDVPEGYTIQPTSFAAVPGGVYIIVVEHGEAYALEISGGSAHAYKMSSDVKEIFVNGNKAYARTVGGRIYLLENGKARSCGSFSGFSNLTNAGCGLLYSAEGALISLTGSATEYPVTKLAGKSNGTLFTADSGKALVCHGSKMAVLRDDYTCAFTETHRQEQSASAAKSNGASEQDEFRAGEIRVVTVGTTFAKLRESHREVLALTDENGKEITGGKLKTGFKACLLSGECTIAVLGDIDGSGTVSGLDIKTLMKHFIGDCLFTGAQEKAADYNRDGQFDNRDLVLLAQQHE